MSPPMTGAGGAINRLQRRREKTHRELIEAARRVIAFNGYHRTRIADIARAAGLGVGTFYLYFPTKQAIFLELVEDTVRRLKHELDAVRAQIPRPDKQARASIETFLRFAQDNRELFRIVFGHGAGFHDVVRAAQESFVRDAVGNLEAGMRAGVFRPHRAEIVAHSLIGLTVQVVTWWLNSDGSVPIEEVTGTVTDLLFHGLLATPPAD